MIAFCLINDEGNIKLDNTYCCIQTINNHYFHVRSLLSTNFHGPYFLLIFTDAGLYNFIKFSLFLLS